MYHAVDAGMIRASVFPLPDPASSWPAMSPDGRIAPNRSRAWIETVWTDDARAAAIELAAPALADGISRVLAGTARRPRHVRTVTALMRYLLRMQYRATPFGLFAGPAPLRLGPATRVRFGTEHRAFASVDASWLHDLIVGLERDPNVLRHLRVIADPTCVVRGTRITIKHRPGPQGPAETTMRRTRAAEKALSLAQSPIAVWDIVNKLHAEYPDTALKTITAMVGDLVKHRVLLSSLHAPMTSSDGLGHLLSQLERTGAAPLLPTTFPALRRLHRVLGRHDHAAPAEQQVLRTQASAAMTELSGVAGRSLAVNLRPDCDVVLPDSVAREAEAALQAIARITPFPHGTSAWSDYRTRFLERYSMGTIVPLRDLTDPDTGLGFPAGYRGTVLKRPILATSPRDEHLLTLAQKASQNHQLAVDLTEGDLEALCAGKPSQVPAHVELCFTVLAETCKELDEGRFHLSVVGLSLAAGTTAGRFLTTLEPADRTRVTAIYAALPTLTEGAERAQVSGPPLKIPTGNVARAPAVVPSLLPVSEHNPAATLDLDDLGVFADSTRLYLTTPSTGRLLEPAVMNAVELSNATHPLIRFVCELHRSHSAALLPFAWGAASRLPFLPEIRIGRTVLSPARWRLRGRDLSDGPNWTTSLMNWRILYGVPRTVSVGTDDRRLRLDLDVPAHQYLLRTEVKRHGTAVLHEAPTDSLFGWIGRAHEVTMAFASTQPPAHPGYPPTALHNRATARLPGASPSAYLKVYGNTDRASEVLTHHLPRLLIALGTKTPDVWFTRYADPDSHVRLRLNLPTADAFGEAAMHVATWASELRSEGLIHRVQWDTDAPETGRYGSGTVLEAAERYFTADSAAALAQLVLPIADSDQPALTAASMVDIATGFLASPAAGWMWLTDNFPKNDGDTAPRDIQALAVRLSTVPDNAASALRDIPRGNHVADMWTLRRKHLCAYRQALEQAGHEPASVLASLLHMHHNRAAGIDPSAEAICRRLARTAALSWTTRAKGAAR
ncbi:lantibiotic dehydratase [Streptomyces sp. NPDC002755]|uniref:lantibiotic dehydratase n=1 Tax=Streptomyces sp. NPDC002884 TaxID=3154544 RepID=UPI0033221DF3